MTFRVVKTGKHTADVNGTVDEELTDSVVTLRPLAPADAEAHLAGEDRELVIWLNGGPGTASTVRAYIDEVGRMWAAGGPNFSFGIRRLSGEVLIGTIDVQLRPPYAIETQANLAFGLYPAWRGQGLATRSVLLALRFLESRPEIEEALIRVDPANPASAAVARRAGFAFLGQVPEDSGAMEWFVKGVR